MVHLHRYTIDRLRREKGSTISGFRVIVIIWTHERFGKQVIAGAEYPSGGNSRCRGYGIKAYGMVFKKTSNSQTLIHPNP